MLLHEADEQHHLRVKISQQIVTGRGREGVLRSLTYHVMLISGTLISRVLGCLLLATLAAPEHALMHGIVRIDSLNQRIKG